MLDHVLALFPPHIHPLTLVSDPDAVLADENLLATLVERGFRLISETDPIALRYVVQQARPFTAESPVIVIASGPLNSLPYDLWQQGYHVILDLHRLFPNLAYPALRELSPGQRHRLSIAQTTIGVPPEPLGYRDTLLYLFQTVFDIVPVYWRSPAHFIAWLDEYHTQNDPMASALAQHLIDELRKVPALTALPLGELLSDAVAYRRFVQRAWDGFLYKQLREHANVTYNAALTLPFDTDHSFQDLVPRLVRSGSLAPVEVTALATLPSWAMPAIVKDGTDRRLRQFAEELSGLEQQVGASDLRWEQWQAIARRWAQLVLWRYDSSIRHEHEALIRFNRVQAILDDTFASWLMSNYTPLATRALPFPHHLHHIPGWLAHQREQQPELRPALLVMDGMALVDWLQIRSAWQTRHPSWKIDERLVLAQIPSITAISRQALISGLRPAQFAASLLHNRLEAQHWSTFWQSQGLPVAASAYALLPTTLGASSYPDIVDSRRTQALCLVNPVIDQMLHGATQGAADVQASIGVWLHADAGQQQRSLWLECLIQHLFDLRYTVVVTSDHGHVEALGMGQPQEGVLVESRSKRARLYTNANIAPVVQMQFAETVLWHNDSLLPPDLQVLMPKGRRAFAPAGNLVVSHGGVTLEELVVPLVTIAQS